MTYHINHVVLSALMQESTQRTDTSPPPLHIDHVCHYMFINYATLGSVPYVYITRHIKPKNYRVYTNLTNEVIRTLLREESQLTQEQLPLETLITHLDNLIQKEEVCRRMADQSKKPTSAVTNADMSVLSFFHPEFKEVKELKTMMATLQKTRLFGMRTLALKQKLRAKRVEEINNDIKCTQKEIREQNLYLEELNYELQTANSTSVEIIL